MTLEEAKQLKPGDRVLVEMVVAVETPARVIDGYGYVWLKKGYAKPEQIREKIVPQRRKFKAGDVVLSSAGSIMLVRCDEGGYPFARLVESFNYHNNHREINDNLWDELTLVCAVGNRADRSAAADGSGVTRKEGEV